MYSHSNHPKLNANIHYCINNIFIKCSHSDRRYPQILYIVCENNMANTQFCNYFKDTFLSIIETSCILWNIPRSMNIYFENKYFYIIFHLMITPCYFIQSQWTRKNLSKVWIMHYTMYSNEIMSAWNFIVWNFDTQ